MSPFDGLTTQYLFKRLGKRAARLLGKGRWALEREALTVPAVQTTWARYGEWVWYRQASYWPAEWYRFQGLEAG